MQSRGFAFVSYYQKSDAESAMQALQGYGYDHLILKLEWAKPSLVSQRTAVRRMAFRFCCRFFLYVFCGRARGSERRVGLLLCGSGSLGGDFCFSSALS